MCACISHTAAYLIFYREKAEGDEDDNSDIDSDDVEYSGDEDFSDEEEEGKKGTYSKYSVSSSVLPRNDNLKLLDAMFDKVCRCVITQ